MINYYFDIENELKPYTFQAEANENTLPPDNALRVGPKFKKGFHPCVKGDKWILVEDNRDKTAYSIETKEPITIDYLGEIKEGFTLLEPFEFCKWNGKKWVLDEQKKTESIIQSNKYIIGELTTEANNQITILQDAIDLDMAEEGEEERLKEWKKYRILLSRVDLTVDGVEWPTKPI